MTGEGVGPEEPVPGEAAGEACELAPDLEAWSAECLADRFQERAADLVRYMEVVADHHLRAQGIPELLTEALRSLHDVIGLDELMAVTVVDRTDVGEGLEVVHHLSRQGHGVTFELTTHLPPPEGGDGPVAYQVPTASGHWRAGAWAEREAWELSGVDFAGHPGLGRLLLPGWWVGHPLRRDGARQATVPHGGGAPSPGDGSPKGGGWAPVDLPRAVMGGPLALSVRTSEGRVTSARVSVGLLHRGLEGLAEGRTWAGVLPLAARAAPRSSVHWQVAYAEAVERLASVDVPARGRALRAALMELERVADHMLAQFSVLDALDCPSAAARVLSDRELVLDAAQALTGQRLVQDAVVLGGVPRDAPEGWTGRLSRLSLMVQAAVREYVREAESLAPMARLEGLAPVHLEDMRGWGLTGPLLRACGPERDARTGGRCMAYRDVPVPVQIREAGDAMARMEQRLLEMAASARVLHQLARSMPGGRVRVAAPDEPRKGIGLGIAEGSRGEVACLVASDGTRRPRRVRWRSPDFAHAAALRDLLIDCPAEDVGLAVRSVDVCVGGVDR